MNTMSTMDGVDILVSPYGEGDGNSWSIIAFFTEDDRNHILIIEFPDLRTMEMVKFEVLDCESERFLNLSQAGIRFTQMIEDGELEKIKKKIMRTCKLKKGDGIDDAIGSAFTVALTLAYVFEIDCDSVRVDLDYFPAYFESFLGMDMKITRVVKYKRLFEKVKEKPIAF